MLLITTVTLVSLLTLVHGHPQCLDFKPPFNTTGLKFCKDYQAFGCCSSEQDIIIQEKYDSIITNILNNDRFLLDDNCKDYLKKILCQECSPFAAHIFDAEQTLVKKPFPGLCQQYCEEFHNTCKNLVPYVTQDRDLLLSLDSRSQFCDKLALSDPDYCYPDWSTNPELTSDVSRDTFTEEGCLCLEPFADNLRNPLSFRYPKDGSGRIFVSEQLGQIHIFYRNGTRLPGLFLDLSSIVLSSSWQGDERGLLGLEFHPDFSDNGKFYLYFSIYYEGRQRIRISEFLVSSDNPNVMKLNSERIILEVIQPYSNHNGGELMFGLDGYLYAFLGDGGAGGDPLGSGQDKTTLLGSVVRIDVNSVSPGKNYSIPADNPFLNEADSRPEIFAYGIRNIWRCDLDEGHPQTGAGRGRIICGDVGQGQYEEIDIIQKGGNFAWNRKEGYSCYQSSPCNDIENEVLPIHVYDHSVGKSVTGGHVYRGCESPNLQGLYFFGDYVNGKIFRLKENTTTDTWTSEQVNMCGTDVCFNGLTNRYGRNILSFGEDQDGEIYVLTTNNPSSTAVAGEIYKLVDPRRRGDPSTCRTYVPPPTRRPPITTTTTAATSTDTVQLPPTITRQNSQQIYYKNLAGNLDIFCEATGVPEPSYIWTKDEVILDIGDVRIQTIPGGIRLNDLDVFDQGDYQCFARNNYGIALTNKVSMRLTVLTRYPPNQPTKTYTVDEGSRLKIICENTTSRPEESTRRDWATVVNGGGQSPMITLDDRIQQDDEGNLVFSHVLKSDERGGNLYGCIVSNRAVVLSTTGSWSIITVNQVSPPVEFVPPQIQFSTGQSSGDTVIALTTEQISLRCLFSGKPSPVVSWSRVYGIIDPDRMVFSQYNTVLTISDVRGSDEGRYICTGTSQQGGITDSKDINLIVQAKPSFLDLEKRPRNVNVTEGDDARFYCDPDAIPPAQITWMKNGVKLEGASLPPRTSIIGHGKILRIEDMCKNCPDGTTDLSGYQCLAENPHGSIITSFYLNVLLATKLTEHHKDHNLVYGEQVTFRCDGTSDTSTPVTFSWSLNNRRISYLNGKIWLEDGGRVLKLKTLNLGRRVLDYIGDYTCVVSNGYSQDTWTATLIKPPGDPRSLCEPSPCQNNGYCHDSEDPYGLGYFCHCSGEYGGRHCQIGSLCEPSPCQNNGYCHDSEDPYGLGYFCHCSGEYGGRHCQIEDPCFEDEFRIPNKERDKGRIPCPPETKYCFRSYSSDYGGRFCFDARFWLLELDQYSFP